MQSLDLLVDDPLLSLLLHDEHLDVLLGGRQLLAQLEHLLVALPLVGVELVDEGADLLRLGLRLPLQELVLGQQLIQGSFLLLGCSLVRIL